MCTLFSKPFYHFILVLLTSFRCIELIEEKRQSVKEEVDTLIAQWKNVNVDELLEKDTEQVPRQTEDRNHDDQITEDGTWENDPDANTNRLVANGSSTTPKESSHTYSAKERRIKRKGMLATSILIEIIMR